MIRYNITMHQGRHLHYTGYRHSSLRPGDGERQATAPLLSDPWRGTLNQILHIPSSQGASAHEQQRDS